MKRNMIIAITLILLTSCCAFAAKYKVNTSGTVKQNGQIVSPTKTQVTNYGIVHHQRLRNNLNKLKLRFNKRLNLQELSNYQRLKNKKPKNLLQNLKIRLFLKTNLRLRKNKFINRKQKMSQKLNLRKIRQY